jgi:hypothetical protein
MQTNNSKKKCFGMSQMLKGENTQCMPRTQRDTQKEWRRRDAGNERSCSRYRL